MMSKALRSIMLRVIKNRIKAGETMEDILNDYPKLTKKDKSDLKDELSKWEN